MDEAWDCEAYGPEGRVVGALCFFSPEGGRTCVAQWECAERMAVQRQETFRLIQEQAAAGDPDMGYLSAAFGSPDQLLNADRESDGNGPGDRQS